MDAFCLIVAPCMAATSADDLCGNERYATYMGAGDQPRFIPSRCLVWCTTLLWHLRNGRLIPQDLYDGAVKALGHDGVTDMIVLIGYYTCVSLTTMNFYGVPASGGGTPRH